MDEYLQFVSIDTWTMIFTLANLVILFLLLKKFLFAPVNKILDERAEQIESEYKTAQTAKSDANTLKQQYETQLSHAKAEAQSIINSAVVRANERSEAILGEAKEEAVRIADKSKKQLEQDKRAAMREIKEDIAGIAVDTAEKILKREIDEKTDEDILLDIINKL